MHKLKPIIENDHTTCDVCSQMSFKIASDELQMILTEMCVNKFINYPVRGGTSWDVSGDLLTFGMRCNHKGVTTLEICSVYEKTTYLVIDKIVPLIKHMHPNVKLHWNVRVSSARLMWVKFCVENISPAFINCIKTVFDEIA
jgi:hypothetical protein